MIKPYKFKKLPSKQKQLEIIAYLAAIYNIDVRIRKRMDAGGYHSNWKEREWIQIHEDQKDLLTVFFHELGHSYCFRNHIWLAIHRGASYRGRTKYFTSEVARKKIKTGLKAERYVENWADQEMRKWFPNLRYEYAYYDKGVENWYKNEFLDRYRRLLKRRGK